MLRHFFPWRRLMPAAFDNDWFVAPSAGFSFKVVYRDTIQLLNSRGTKTKALRGAQRFIDNLDHPVILTEGI